MAEYLLASRPRQANPSPDRSAELGSHQPRGRYSVPPLGGAQLLPPTWRTKAIQVLLALLLFALPAVFVPSALNEEVAGRWVRGGLPRNTVKELLLPGSGASPFAPQDPARRGERAFRFALVAGEGVFRYAVPPLADGDRQGSSVTDDGATDWQPADGDLPSKRWPSIQVQALAADAINPSIIYAGMGGAGSRNPAQSAGLYTSNDGGETWQSPVKSMAGQEIQAIAIMPRDLTADDPNGSLVASGDRQSAGNVVCVAASGGIYCNTGEGQSWVRLDWGGAETRVLSLVIGPDAPQTVYVGTDGLGLAITQDGGATWLQPDGGLQGRRVYDIVISPAHPDYIYAATDDGVFRSADAGATWTQLEGPTKGRRVNTIALGISSRHIATPAAQDPDWDQAILYVGLQHSAAYRSVDGGANWVPFRKGLGDLTILSLAVDPKDPSMLWAGTTDGIWRYEQPDIPSEMAAEPPPVTPTNTHTATVTRPVAAAVTPTHQPVLTLTRTPLPSPTSTATKSPTPTVTRTLPPTATRTPQPSSTPRPSPTPTATGTSPPPPVSVPPSPSAVPTETRVPR